MEKLELKDLAPYLPYGLKIRSSEGMTEILGYEWVNGKIIYQLDTDDDSGDFAFDDPIKPILRPLSDLTKEIEIDGEKLVPMKWFSESEYYKRGLNQSISNWQHLKNHYFTYNLLFKWHFDVFGLIEKGLAIDINTL